jgi:hypothetical protein
MTQRIGIGVIAVALASGLTTASDAQTTTSLVNDTWIDNTRTDSEIATNTDSDGDGDIESPWFNGSAVPATPATLEVTAGPPAGPLVGTPGGGSTWTTYFKNEGSEVNLANAGDALEVRWVFTPTGVNATDAGQGLRFGLVDSPAATRLTSDAYPSIPPDGTNYNGYGLFMNMQTPNFGGRPLQIRERTATAGQGMLNNSAGWTTISNGPNGGSPGYVDGTTYTLTFKLTRNEVAGLDLAARLEGEGLGAAGEGFLENLFTDTTPISFTFDTVGILAFPSNNTAAMFETSLFNVQLTTAPPAGNANFDGVGGTNGNDFLIWQQGLGQAGTGTLATGDANGDFNVDSTDLGIWKGTFGTPVVGAAVPIPEPTAVMSGVIGLLGLAGFCDRRRP